MLCCAWRADWRSGRPRRTSAAVCSMADALYSVCTGSRASGTHTSFRTRRRPAPPGPARQAALEPPGALSRPLGGAVQSCLPSSGACASMPGGGARWPLPRFPQRRGRASRGGSAGSTRAHQGGQWGGRARGRMWHNLGYFLYNKICYSIQEKDCLTNAAKQPGLIRSASRRARGFSSGVLVNLSSACSTFSVRASKVGK